VAAVVVVVVVVALRAAVQACRKGDPFHPAQQPDRK
jgi:hypothetical protein